MDQTVTVCLKSGNLAGWWLHLHSITQVTEVIQTHLVIFCTCDRTEDGFLSFSLSPAADRYSAAAQSGRLGLDQHSCWGSRISPVFLSHISLPWSLLFPLRSSSTLQPQEQIQDSSGHEGTSSVVSPLPAFLHPTSVRPVGGALRLGRAEQTDRALCTRQSGPTLGLSPFYSGQPCWLQRHLWIQGTGSHIFRIVFIDCNHSCSYINFTLCMWLSHSVTEQFKMVQTGGHAQ